MFSSLTSRRGFAARLATLLPGLAAGSAVAAATPAPQAPVSVKKLDYEGNPAGTGFITPLILHNFTIYIAGQGAHSHDPEGKFPYGHRDALEKSNGECQNAGGNRRRYDEQPPSTDGLFHED